jgi:hypothetical protein
MTHRPALDSAESSSSSSHAIRPGTVLSPRHWPTLSGTPAVVPDPDAITHIQFRRFAGCPICNLHLRSFVRGADELTAAGIREVVVFHSALEELRKYESDLPFDVIPDPQKKLYREFGVEAGMRALLSPNVWWPLARGGGRSVLRLMRGRGPVPPLQPTGGGLGLPADFLVSAAGKVLAAHYGEHAYDQWPVDQVRRLAEQA